MNKLQLTLTSLVAVIPAAFLIFLLIGVMLTDSQNLSTIAFVVMGITLLSAGATVLIPAVVWVGGRQSPKLATAKVSVAKPKASEDDIESEEDDIESIEGDDDIVEESSDSFVADDELGESDDFDMEHSDEMLSGDFEANVDTEPVEDFEDFDLEEEEEEPKPKKKKR